MCNLLRLAFSLSIIPSIHPKCCIYSRSLPFDCEEALWCAMHCSLLIRSHAEAFGCFKFLAVVNRAAINIHVQVCERRFYYSE